jgi:hypothetical protein
MRINNTLTEDIIRINGADIDNILKINNTFITIPLITTNLTYHIDFSNTICYPGTGTSIRDLATNLTYSAVNGPTFSSASGINAGGSFNFDGVNDYLISTTNVDFMPNQFTIQTWVWVSGSQAGNRGLWNVENSNTDGVRMLTLGTSNSALHRVRNRINNNNFNSTNDAAGTLDFQQWYLTTFTFNDTTDTVKIYINDTLNFTGTYTSSIDVNAERICIGANTNGGLTGVTNFLNGRIGASYVYVDKEFTDEEVIQNWNSTKYRYGY